MNLTSILKASVELFKELPLKSPIQAFKAQKLLPTLDSNFSNNLGSVHRRTLRTFQIHFADTPPTLQLSGVATMEAVSSKLYGRRRTLIKQFDIIIVSSVRLGGEKVSNIAL